MQPEGAWYNYFRAYHVILLQRIPCTSGAGCNRIDMDHVIVVVPVKALAPWTDHTKLRQQWTLTCTSLQLAKQLDS